MRNAILKNIEELKPKDKTDKRIYLLFIVTLIVLGFALSVSG